MADSRRTRDGEQLACDRECRERHSELAARLQRQLDVLLHQRAVEHRLVRLTEDERPSVLEHGRGDHRVEHHVDSQLLVEPRPFREHEPFREGHHLQVDVDVQGELQLERLAVLADVADERADVAEDRLHAFESIGRAAHDDRQLPLLDRDDRAGNRRIEQVSTRSRDVDCQGARDGRRARGHVDPHLVGSQPCDHAGCAVTDGLHRLRPGDHREDHVRTLGSLAWSLDELHAFGHERLGLAGCPVVAADHVAGCEQSAHDPVAHHSKPYEPNLRHSHSPRAAPFISD